MFGKHRSKQCSRDVEVYCLRWMSAACFVLFSASLLNSIIIEKNFPYTMNMWYLLIQIKLSLILNASLFSMPFAYHGVNVLWLS